MSDIECCSGEGCPIKENCYRFTAKRSEPSQWFIHPPYTITNGIFKCSLFWGVQQTSILDQLKEIVSGKLNKKQ